MSSPRIACFDIECTNLNANFGYVLCASWKFLDEKKIHTVSIMDFGTFGTQPTNDRYVVNAIARELEKADVIVSWYGKRFDFKYIQSRLLLHGLKLMPPIPHVDGWEIARKNLRLNSNRLASVAAFLGLEQKTPLSGPIWVKAAAGHGPSIRYVIKHCEQDVLVLEQAYLKLRPLAEQHPNLNLIQGTEDACPKCGSEGTLVKKGFRYATTLMYQRYRCRACGGWCRSRVSEKTSVKVRS